MIDAFDTLDKNRKGMYDDFCQLEPPHLGEWSWSLIAS